MKKLDVSWSENPAADVGKIPVMKTNTAGEPRAARVANPLKVVLVDDSSRLRACVAALLSAVDGVEVVGEAENVAAGKWLLQRESVDVLILDIDLPGESGLALLQFARATAPSLTIIMLSNTDHPKLREKCAGLGASFYFYKLTEIERTADVCRELAAVRDTATGSQQQAAPGTKL